LATTTRFKLEARVSSANLRGIRPILEGVIGKGTIVKVNEEYLVTADLEGRSAKDLNRLLLSALRRTEKKTRLRAEWTSADGTTFRFFDYVLKKTVKPGPR